MAQVNTPFSIMGSTISPAGNRNAARMVAKLRMGQQLTLLRQPKNPHDPNAILVMWGTWPLGYVPRGLAAVVAPIMDRGVNVIVRKARNALYGVCELAYIAPPEPAALAPATELPDGVTQADLDAATDLPPLDDSQPPQDAEAAELLSVEEADILYPTEGSPHEQQSTEPFDEP